VPSDILPATFLVIVMTVMVYGLTASPMARLLGVARAARTRPLLVGGLPWVVDLGRALQSAGLDVLMWAGLQEQRDHIGRAGLELAPGELLAAAAGRGAQLEGITAVLLLTDEDDFNALASTTLQGNLDGLVYRAAPRPGHGVIAPHTGSEILFGDPLTGLAISRRHHDGAEIATRPAQGAVPDGYDLLFVVRANGRLVPVTAHGRPALENDDTLVLLGPAPQAAPDDRRRSTADSVHDLDPGF
jgi:hypothetical protein